jgi:hypothetical protein
MSILGALTDVYLRMGDWNRAFTLQDTGLKKGIFGVHGMSLTLVHDTMQLDPYACDEAVALLWVWARLAWRMNNLEQPLHCYALSWRLIGIMQDRLRFHTSRIASPSLVNGNAREGEDTLNGKDDRLRELHRLAEMSKMGLITAWRLLGGSLQAPAEMNDRSIWDIALQTTGTSSQEELELQALLRATATYEQAVWYASQLQMQQANLLLQEALDLLNLLNASESSCLRALVVALRLRCLVAVGQEEEAAEIGTLQLQMMGDTTPRGVGGSSFSSSSSLEIIPLLWSLANTHRHCQRLLVAEGLLRRAASLSDRAIASSPSHLQHSQQQQQQQQQHANDTAAQTSLSEWIQNHHYSFTTWLMLAHLSLMQGRIGACLTACTASEQAIVHMRQHVLIEEDSEAVLWPLACACWLRVLALGICQQDEQMLQSLERATTLTEALPSGSYYRALLLGLMQAFLGRLIAWGWDMQGDEAEEEEEEEEEDNDNEAKKSQTVAAAVAKAEQAFAGSHLSIPALHPIRLRNQLTLVEDALSRQSWQVAEERLRQLLRATSSSPDSCAGQLYGRMCLLYSQVQGARAILAEREGEGDTIWLQEESVRWREQAQQWLPTTQQPKDKKEEEKEGEEKGEARGGGYHPSPHRTTPPTLHFPALTVVTQPSHRHSPPIRGTMRKKASPSEADSQSHSHNYSHNYSHSRQSHGNGSRGRLGSEGLASPPRTPRPKPLPSPRPASIASRGPTALFHSPRP